MTFRIHAALLALPLLAFAHAPAWAAANLVVNGDFEQETVNGVAGNVSSEFGGRYSSVQVTGWATNSYSMIYTPGTADRAGAQTEYNSQLVLWGPNSGSANAMPATSPVGGNFIAADGAYFAAPITQTVGGLTVGNLYQLSFYWAAAQQKGYDGPTTENWTVAFGNQSFTTPTVSNANHGFVPWTQQSFYFTASATSQTLSFLAAGTPSGTPPFSLLDGVSLTQAPEPATWAVMMAGLAGLVLVSRRRKAARRGTALPG